MLKAIYKFILVSVLSGSLLMLDFSYKGMMVRMNEVQAETLKTDAIGKDSNIAATLVMVGAGMLASRLYRYKMTTDIMIAAAGGAAFIAGDIIEFFKIKEKLKDMETEIKRDVNGNLDNKQIESLEKLKKSYQTAKETANTKKMLQMAAAAAFAAAAATAFMMAANEEAQQAQCLLGLQNAASSAAATVGATCSAMHATAAACCGASPACGACPSLTQEAITCDKDLAACQAKIQSDMATFTKYITAREKPEPSAPGFAETSAIGSTISSTFPASTASCGKYAQPMAAAEAAGVCPGKVMVDMVDYSTGTPGTMLANAERDLNRILYPSVRSEIIRVSSFENDTYLDKIVSLFIPSAKAGLFDPLGIAGSAAVSFILAYNTSLATTLDLNLLIPKRRAIAWGILAALALAASMATGSEIGKIQSNIDRIDAILNAMYKMDKGVKQANVAVSNPKIDSVPLNGAKLQAFNANLTNEVDLAASGKTMPCFTSKDGNSCPSFSDGLKQASNNFSNFPDTVKSQIGNISALGDGINGTGKISGGTLDAAQALASQQNALNAEMIKKQKALQDLLKSKGRKDNLDLQSKKFEEGLRAALAKQLEIKKMSASDAYANYYGGRGGIGKGAEAGSDAKKEAGLAEGKGLDKKGGLGAGLGSIAIPADQLDKDAKKAFSDEDKALQAELAAKLAEEEAAKKAAEASKSASIDDYDLKNQITKDPETSIFEVISNRYQKSGYPRLFKRIK